MSIRLMWALFILPISLLGTSVAAQDISQYRMSAGDVISIRVLGEPDLTFEELRLTDAGSFSYPFIGEVKAKGKTVAQIEELLLTALKGKYLVSPRVSVNVLEYRHFYIIGEVKLPGGYPYQPGLTLRRAAALAGGLTERASAKRITIIRDLDPAQGPVEASMDTPVLPGDTVTIEEGFF
ncbi:polysaccharide biosynthesis/export family protein [Stutzerimonas stutzeri]|uniref:Polysaccharide export protein n=1 Tax=Stutzerimonas stutzeri TaxID=316 RepID=A0A6I6LKC4_STUST|nr:polysaccharide biosynthesis/export family protein [Stutzerimonas stutzeri]QGZ31044.1 polysaccharide export protein [Stutzerimonas stutzeri]